MAMRLMDNNRTAFTGSAICIVLVSLISVWSLNAMVTDNIKVIVLNLGMCFMIIMAIFFILLKVLAKYDANETKSRNLNERMAAAAQIYYEFKEVDIINNTIRSAIDREDDEGELKDADGTEAQQHFYDYVNNEVEEHFKLQMKEFVDFSILGVLLEYRVAATTTFLTTFLWILEDISEERQQRDALIDVSNRVVAASKAKTAFLSTISNELRAPIDAVLGINDMILSETSEPQTVRYSESIRDASVDLLGMINDILDFSIIEAGKMEIVSKKYDFLELINDLVQTIKPQAEDKGLSFILDIDANTPKDLYGDGIRVKQIMLNLLTNAVKYTSKGRVILTVASEKMDERHVALHVSVKDTGQGIKNEDKSRLFVEFERIEEGKSSTVGGTGLGVTITQRLLELMGSNLEVESVYKLGSNFYFVLEQTVVHWEPIGDIVMPSVLVSEDKALLPRFISELPEVNMENGIKNNGDEESYLEALKVYASSVGKYTEEITEFLKADDLENATIKIHALKSTSRIIGAESIGELALALENAGKAGDKEKVENEVGGLLERCKALGQQLRPLLEPAASKEEAGDTGKPAISDEKLTEAYAKLRECAAACDSFGIEEVLAELGNYQLTEPQQGKMTDLSQAIDNFDFEKVSEILKEEK